MACPFFYPDTGVSLEYRHLIQGPDKDIWVKALANDSGCLSQGVKDRMPTGNSTIFFIHHSEIPTHKKITYGRLVVDIRPLKEENIVSASLLEAINWILWLCLVSGSLSSYSKNSPGNSTIFFIHPRNIPTHKKVTYGRLVVDIRPLKEEKYRIRITVGGDKLDFCGDASSVAASLATVKLLLNSVVSTKGANSQQLI